MPPEVGVSRSAMTRSSVVLPQPEGPMKETNSPFATLRLALSRAWTALSPVSKVSDRLRISIAISELTSDPPSPSLDEPDRCKLCAKPCPLMSNAIVLRPLPTCLAWNPTVWLDPMRRPVEWSWSGKRHDAMARGPEAQGTKGGDGAAEEVDQTEMGQDARRRGQRAAHPRRGAFGVCDGRICRCSHRRDRREGRPVEAEPAVLFPHQAGALSRRVEADAGHVAGAARPHRSRQRPARSVDRLRDREARICAGLSRGVAAVCDRGDARGPGTEGRPERRTQGICRPQGDPVAALDGPRQAGAQGPASPHLHDLGDHTALRRFLHTSRGYHRADASPPGFFRGGAAIHP